MSDNKETTKDTEKLDADALRRRNWVQRGKQRQQAQSGESQK